MNNLQLKIKEITWAVGRFSTKYSYLSPRYKLRGYQKPEKCKSLSRNIKNIKKIKKKV